MEGGLYDPRLLPASLIDEMHRCGSQPCPARTQRRARALRRSARAQRPDDDGARLGRTERKRFEAAFPDHRTVLYDNASHFLQEDVGDRIAEAVQGFSRRKRIAISAESLLSEVIAAHGGREPRRHPGVRIAA
jgi:hypothetical protein